MLVVPIFLIICALSAAAVDSGGLDLAVHREVRIHADGKGRLVDHTRGICLLQVHAQEVPQEHPQKSGALLRLRGAWDDAVAGVFGLGALREDPNGRGKPKFQRPSTRTAMRELVMIPALLFVGIRSRSTLLLAIVFVQLITHFVIVSTSFHCNPRPWCNLPALSFGLVYLAIGGANLHAARDASEADKGWLCTTAALDAVVVIIIGCYIVASHLVAMHRHQDDYLAWLP
eukprot:TRINITY_DN7990_c0_g1_i1.p1 TRINITY_DN7990_c0_g1~~TRINITY_DN7990_c0_g1_i1.p1  ORF type:complete len:230 (-),score=23.73 TRINITY_DN7990_c0_g1_i1:114-803(-)